MTAAPGWPAAGPARLPGWFSSAGDQADLSGEGRLLGGTQAEGELQRLVGRHPHAGEDRGLALGIAACLGFSELHDEVEEGGRLVTLERDHELLVVEAEGVGSVDLDLRIAMADGEVLDHHGLATLVREAVPDALLPHRIDKEVTAAGGFEPSTQAFLVRMPVAAEVGRRPH